jgi:hypothetical protein
MSALCLKGNLQECLPTKFVGGVYHQKFPVDMNSIFMKLYVT